MDPIVFVACSKDNNIVNASSSGGIFYHIAHYYLDLGAHVYGATIDSNGNVFHIMVNNNTSLPLIMKSKYVESYISKQLINGLVDDIKNGIFVVFSGTPCQISMIYHVLLSNNLSLENVFLIDLICHGVPKKVFWNHFLDIVNIDGKKDIDFRNKRFGWEDYSLKINNTIFRKNNYYYSNFFDNYFLCEKCFKCHFKGENRYSDITLGDAWGLCNYESSIKNKNGMSLIVVRTDKFDIKLLSNEIYLKKVDYFQSLYLNNPFYFISAEKPVDRDLKNDSFLQSKDLGELSKEIKRNRITMITKYIKKKIHNLLRNLYGININYFKRFDLGIVTMDGYYNFGNRLQNFALHMFLRMNNYKTVNLVDEKSKRPFDIVLNRKSKEYVIYKSSKKYEGRLCIVKKNHKLKNIKAIIVGSDQVWNYIWPLQFRHGICKDINHNIILSYSASFGFKSLDKKYMYLYKNELNKFRNLSVREEDGLKILREIGYDGRFDVDPVFLLDINDYMRYIDYSSLILPNGKYILKYCLEGQQEPQLFYEYPIINILDDSSPFYNISHFDFLKLIINSEYVITNSFHCTAFSLMFGKKTMLLDLSVNIQTKNRFDFFFAIVDFFKNYGDYFIFPANSINREKINKYVENSRKNLLNYVKNI